MSVRVEGGDLTQICLWRLRLRRAGLGQATSSPYVLRQTGSAYQHARYEQVCVSGWTTDPIPPAAPTLPCPPSGEPATWGRSAHNTVFGNPPNTTSSHLECYRGRKTPRSRKSDFKVNFLLHVSKKRHHTYLFGFIKRLKIYNLKSLVL